MPDRLDRLARQMMRKTVLTASLAIAVQVGSVHAQTASAPPPFTPLRYNEDYSYLRDPDQRSGAWWEPFKFIPFDSAGWAWLSVGDEVRFRYERYWANNFRSGSSRTKATCDTARLPKTAVRGADQQPFFYVLEDDALVTEVSVTAEQLLEPVAGVNRGSHD